MQVTLVLATTVAPFVMKYPERWGSWLTSTDNARTFAAIETDRRGTAPFDDLLDMVDDHWAFSLDDGRTSVNMTNRRRHIAMGQALAMEYAECAGAEWFAFTSADTALPRGWFHNLLAVCEQYGQQALGVRIPALHTGQPSETWQGRPQLVRRRHHGGFFMLHRDLFTKFRARAAADYGEEITLNESLELLGTHMVYREDVVADHYPRHVAPYAQRYNGKDLEVRW